MQFIYFCLSKNSKHSESTQSAQTAFREKESNKTSSYRRSLKYFVLFDMSLININLKLFVGTSAQVNGVKYFS